jgi:hypothetical protein
MEIKFAIVRLFVVQLRRDSSIRHAAAIIESDPKITKPYAQTA